jgi:hypothetical protein
VGEDRTPPNINPTPYQRVTVHHAARVLGISEDAVRMRVKRGTLESEREGSRLYVFLTTDPTPDPTDRTNELIDELRDRVRSLEDQLKEEREANRENRRIIAALTSRIPELEAPSQPRESPVRAADEQDRGGEPRSTTPGYEEPISRRPWWRRTLGSWWVRRTLLFSLVGLVLAVNIGSPG